MAIALVSFIATGIVAALLSVLLARTPSRPISRMTESAKRLSGERNMERGDSGDVEFADLSGSLERLEATIQELSTEKNKLELIVDHITDGIFLLNPDGEVLLANPATQKILHLSDEQIVGHPLSRSIGSREIEDLAQKSMAEKTASELKVEISKPRKRYLKVTALPILDDGKRVIGSMCIVQDRTKERRLDKMRRDFVANVSHELKTPITGLKLLSETLMVSIEDDKEAVQHFAGRMLSDMNRLSRLIDDLLILSGLEAPEKKMERLPIDLGAITLEVVRDLAHLAAKKGLEFSTSVDESVPPITGDPALLRTLVENIVENAIKYTSEGSVKVEVAAAHKKIALSVTDTGPGVADEDIKRIFERFYRVDKDRSRATGGTGLGLSIVKHIARNHGASIDVVSKVGRGSTFKIIFPMA